MPNTLFNNLYLLFQMFYYLFIFLPLCQSFCLLFETKNNFYFI